MASKLTHRPSLSRDPFSKNRKLDLLLAAMGIIPFVFIVYLVYKYHVNAPYGDQWYLVPMVDRFYHGKLTFYHLWSQFGDHRIFFPKVIALALVEMSSWNTLFELSFNIVLYAALCVVILVQIRKSLSLIGSGFVSMFIPMVSVIVFSAQNWENWLCGLQITYSLNFLCAVSGLLLLCEPRHRIGSLIAAFLLGLVATHSFSFGLAYWPVGFIPLILWRGENRPLRRGFLLLWTGCSALGYLTFFYGYVRIADPVHSKFYGSRIYDVVLFTLSLLGNPLRRLFDLMHLPQKWTLVGSLVLFTLLGLSAYVISRFAKDKLAVMLPYVCVIFYAVLSSMLIAVGRSGAGIGPAFWVRYSMAPNLAWLSLTVLAIMSILVLWPFRAVFTRLSSCVLILLFSMVCLSYIGCAAVDSVMGVKSFKRFHQDLQEPYRALLCSEKSDKVRPLLPWSVEFLQKQADVLKRLELSVYSKSLAAQREDICGQADTAR
ncbi:MAG: hypothetical protein HY788_09525 [Deltaproteobacteria bacterium]|nr:hypothetical protein [Deltaproteobacteria bacterium]